MRRRHVPHRFLAGTLRPGPRRQDRPRGGPALPAPGHGHAQTRPRLRRGVRGGPLRPLAGRGPPGGRRDQGRRGRGGRHPQHPLPRRAGRKARRGGPRLRRRRTDPDRPALGRRTRRKARQGQAQLAGGTPAARTPLAGRLRGGRLRPHRPSRARRPAGPARGRPLRARRRRAHGSTARSTARRRARGARLRVRLRGPAAGLRTPAQPRPADRNPPDAQQGRLAGLDGHPADGPVPRDALPAVRRADHTGMAAAARHEDRPGRRGVHRARPAQPHHRR